MGIDKWINNNLPQLAAGRCRCPGKVVCDKNGQMVNLSQKEEQQVEEREYHKECDCGF